MRERWLYSKIADGPIEIVDGDRGKNYPKQSDFASRGHCLFLNTGNVTRTGFNFETVQFISAVTDRALRKGKLQREDLVMTTRGTVGNVAYYHRSVPHEHVRINSGMVIFRPDTSKLLPLFLYQFLRSPDFTDQVAALRSGSAQPQLPIRDINRIEIPIPPLPEQRAIASILGALDDKIELNRRMNATLESLAAATFKSWFIDFDPVRAKMDGRHPARMDEETAGLFPDSLVHQKDRLAPAGWRLARWGELATLEYGKSLRNYRDGGGKYPVFGTNGPIGSHDVPICDTAGIVVGRKGAYRGVHYSPGPFFVIDTAYYLRPKSPFNLRWAFFELFNFDINNIDSGSAIPSTSREDFYGIRVVVPPVEVQYRFGRVVEPFYARIYAHEAETNTLAALRDTLLPKLLSGELRVADAERAVEAAV